MTLLMVATAPRARPGGPDGDLRRSDGGLPRQQRSEGELRGGGLFLHRDVPELFDQYMVLPAILGREARDDVAEIVLRKSRRLVDLAGWKALAERAERNEADAHPGASAATRYARSSGFIAIIGAIASVKVVRRAVHGFLRMKPEFADFDGTGLKS